MANVKSEVETRVKFCRMARCRSGFSLIEVMLVVAIMGILAVLATPMFLTYYQGAQLRVAAEEVATFLNHGRQLGIKENVGVCVEITATAMHYRVGGCGGSIWLGPGTDAAGNVSVPQGVTLTTTAVQVVFSYLGAASPAATYTVTNTQTAATLQVKVAASGRVCIAPSTSCP
jgi:prepilin-type N-terminal cleavage/methylation domain-containing protein